MILSSEWSQQEAWMSAYIRELNAAVERDQAQHAEKERAATQAARERLTPLEERLGRLLSTIPMEPPARRIIPHFSASRVAWSMAGKLPSRRIGYGTA